SFFTYLSPPHTSTLSLHDALPIFRLNGPFFFCLGAFLFRGFLFGHLCSIDPFDKGHGSGVALALAKPHDARVTPIAIGRSRRDLVEQFLHRDLLPQCCQSIPSRVDRKSVV